ncbi:L,D-transpeptidase family protein [Stutzerimonas nitrititolerans]|uniref:L,D-transpeptidase family protein n=1 Tax=Stutzerimonas nitrititolerans TaxID=2482751 RepID=UPI0028B0570C|nr:L,D-transpeptidase family protein [Stutzerimonas nitrititolerans]
MFKKRAFRLLFGLLFIPLTSLAEPVENPPEAIRGVLEHLESCPAVPRTLDQAALDRLSELYRRHGFEPLWTSYAQIQNLVAQLEALTDDGLDPALYQPQQVGRQLQTATADPLHRPCSDVLASHAYLLALQHLSQGRLRQEQLEPVWHSSSASETVSSQRVLQLAEQGLANPEQAFDQARPAIEQYRNLRKAYVRLRDTPAPAWPNIPAGQTLRPGMSDPRVPLLRERLASEGYLETALPLEGADDRHGPMLVEALKRFQAQHALQDDGVLGAGTLAALNATPADRLDQLRANLERFRWLAGDIEADSLLVDIAGGRVIYFRDHQARWEARTQVGRAARQTPAIKSRVNRLTLNPTWTVPPTIMREDKLPKIRQDLAYLEQQQLQVLDPQGKQLDPASVNWAAPGAIMLRQAAGPSNPLGRVAIRFANPFSIYLHDTPSQQLFARAPRAFSSGCVRVESVMQLVELLLTDAERERVTQLLESGKTVEFRLSQPMPILLAYWTAGADASGQPFYRPDIYQRDAALIRALDKARTDS